MTLPAGDHLLRVYLNDLTTDKNRIDRRLHNVLSAAVKYRVHSLSETSVIHIGLLWNLPAPNNTGSTMTMRQHLAAAYTICKDFELSFASPLLSVIKELLERHANSFARDSIFDLTPSDHREISRILFASMDPVSIKDRASTFTYFRNKTDPYVC